MFYTVKEVAQHLKISLSMVYALINRRDLIAHEIGSCKRIKQADLEAYLEQQRNEPARLPKNVGRHF